MVVAPTGVGKSVIIPKLFLHYYDYQGNLLRTENFTNGQLNGKSSYFDKNGNLFPMEKLYEPTILKTKINE